MNTTNQTKAKQHAERAAKIIARQVAKARVEHGDSSDGIFVGQLLNSILPEAFVWEYPDLKFASGDLIRYKTDIDEGAETWGYQEINYTGSAQFVADGAIDLPTADITGAYNQFRVRSIAQAYTITTQEIRASRMNGTFDIVSQKLDAARRAVALRMESAMIAGDALTGYVGLPNTSGITTAVAAGAWSAASAATIVGEVNALITAIATASGGVEIPDTVVMGVDNYRRCSTLQNSVASDITVLDYLKRANPQITRWEWSSTLDTGYSGGKVVLAFNAKKLAVTVPMTLTPLDPQWRGLGYNQTLEMRYGGLWVPSPVGVGRLTNT